MYHFNAHGPNRAIVRAWDFAVPLPRDGHKPANRRTRMESLTAKRSPKSNRAFCTSALVRAQDDSYTRVTRYQVLH